MSLFRTLGYLGRKPTRAETKRHALATEIARALEEAGNLVRSYMDTIPIIEKILAGPETVQCGHHFLDGQGRAVNRCPVQAGHKGPHVRGGPDWGRE